MKERTKLSNSNTSILLTFFRFLINLINLNNQISYVTLIFLIILFFLFSINFKLKYFKIIPIIFSKSKKQTNKIIIDNINENLINKNE